MRYQSVILAVVMLVVVVVQSDETKLDAAQAKITSVSAMRVRRAPQVSAEEVQRLKLGTVANAIARSTNQAENPQPSDCEGDEVCGFFRLEGEIQYLSVHPNGAHATEAIKNLTEGITEDVIKRTNARGGNQYDVQEQTALRKTFASLRLTLAKTTAPEKTELLNKLKRIH